MAEERQNHFGTGYGSSKQSAKRNAIDDWEATKPKGWKGSGRFTVTSEFEDKVLPMNMRWEVKVMKPMKPIKRKAHEQTNADSPAQPGAAGIDSVITDGRVNGSELERT